MKGKPGLKRGLSLALSAVLHVIVVLLMFQAMLSPRGFTSLFRGRSETVPADRITYVIPAVTVTPPRSTVRVTPPAVRITPPAPTNVPVVIPAIPAAGAHVATMDTGTVRNTGTPPSGAGALPGLNPANPDPRLYGAGPPSVEPPKRTGLAGIEYGLDSALRAKRDSISKLSDPKDWTVGEGKKKFGLDESWLYLGPIKIPSLVLGLIPLRGIQGNPGAYDRSKTLGAMATEVRERGAIARSQSAEIDRINERTDRERNARLRAAAAAAAGGGGGKVPP